MRMVRHLRRPLGASGIDAIGLSFPRLRGCRRLHAEKQIRGGDMLAMHAGIISQLSCEAAWPVLRAFQRINEYIP